MKKIAKNSLRIKHLLITFFEKKGVIWGNGKGKEFGVHYLITFFITLNYLILVMIKPLIIKGKGHEKGFITPITPSGGYPPPQFFFGGRK